MHDDELLNALGDELTGEISPVDETRVDDLRALVAAAVGHGVTTAEPREIAPSREHRWWHRPRWEIALAAACIGAVAAIGIFSATDSGPDGETEFAGEIAGPGGQAELEIVKTGIGRVVELDTDDLEILPTGEYYEIWFVGPGDTADSPNRISAGTFHPDDQGRSRVTFAAAVDPTKYPVLEITSEPGDGDPRASGLVVLQGSISD